MKSVGLRSFIVLLLLCGCSYVSRAQENISEFVRKSNINMQQENALYFIDFWATWCGPCIHVAKQLEIFQKQFPENFYIISLTKENRQTVEEFLIKHPTELAVAIDDNGRTFDKYKIKNLPYGVLLNADEKVLWTGNSADLRPSIVNAYLKKYEKKVSVDKMFNVNDDYVKETELFEYIPKTDFELIEKKQNLSGALIIKEGTGYVHYSGRVKSFFAYLLNVSGIQISIPESYENRHYDLYVSLEYSKEEILEKLIERLNLTENKSQANGNVLLMDFNVNDPDFWDTNQILWDEGTPDFLIDDFELTANNVTFQEMTGKLSDLLEIPIITSQPYISKEKHDWQIHYKYFNLMQSGLESAYNIKISKEKSQFKVYEFNEKTP